MDKSKSHWRYQVINRGTIENPSLGIHEIYFNTEKKGDIMWTENPNSLDNYESLEELISTLEMILKDIKNYPILLESELENKL
ncbi:hypothetical protein BAS06_02980 [Elizabethkingia miricola]|uniref:hypothetical protein n=1 Tax=Elizabethkingia miricola TaxID=172045 RepID=UPI00099ACCEE|nr:hypothetical protein [Elizabethkingia miricola]MCT4185327.1 hypothetical protein [Elizabethkingia anophelis]MCT4274436.1 hypothetical protein [Elizabethkingia anophelis]MCT4292043.1 hypothetical protein [Elizabethkingia anophelis]MDV3462474.1 hypothetical protein [Elizabethkingia anophelis]MDV3631352.1 hypothetical protein [Elizabethkingia anophelis]